MVASGQDDAVRLQRLMFPTGTGNGNGHGSGHICTVQVKMEDTAAIRVFCLFSGALLIQTPAGCIVLLTVFKMRAAANR